MKPEKSIGSTDDGKRKLRSCIECFQKGANRLDQFGDTCEQMVVSDLAPQMLPIGSVVTNLGYSDWATQDVTSKHRAMWYRISKQGSHFLLENSYDGQAWLQMRIAHLHKEAKDYEIGVYACSPTGKDFRCCFKSLEIADNRWHAIPDAS
jgi:Protein of unknown function (DUF1349)